MAEETDPLERLDYYALLQIEPGTNADGVRDAFHRFAAKYHPDRFRGAGADAIKVERAAQIYRRGAEAYKVLTDPQKRAGYDRGLSEGHVRYDPNDITAAAPTNLAAWPLKVKNPMARPFAVKAEQAQKAGDFATAKMNLKLVLSKDPGNAQAAQLLADVEASRVAKLPTPP